MNTAVGEITRILYDSAFKIFGRSVLIKEENNNTDRKNNDWFDEKCKSERHIFHQVRNFFFRHPTDVNRQSYIDARNRFNRIKRQAQVNYKRRMGIELCDIAKTDPLLGLRKEHDAQLKMMLC